MKRPSYYRKRFLSWGPVAALAMVLPRNPLGLLTWGTLRRLPARTYHRTRHALRQPSLWASMWSLARAGLSHRYLPILAIFLALSFCLPTLWNGFGVDDDLLHRAILLTSSLPDALKGLFVFAEPGEAARLMDQGLFPWWASSEVRVAFFRPLAALTHWLDYRLWPNTPALMHAQSLLWYGLMCGLAAWVYQRIMGRRLSAGLAALLFAVNVPHFSGVAALNARNAIMASAFGLLALGLHHSWRREGRRAGAWFGPLCLALSLLSAEAGIASAFYLFAYAVCLDRGAWRKRLLSLAPYAVIIVVWRLAYQWMGYGASGSNFYLDPGQDIFRFGLAVLERWGGLLFGQWVMPDPGIPALLSLGARWGYWLIAAGFIVLLGLGVWPLLRDNPEARFWALGMALAITPVCAISPALGRHTMFMGWGALALLAQLVAGVLAPARWLPASRAWRWAAGALGLLLVGLQGLIYPSVVLCMPGVFQNGVYVAMSDLGALPQCQEQDVVIVNAPSPGQAMYMLSFLEARGEPTPARLRMLAPAYSRVSLTRVDANTLLARPELGYLLPPATPVGKTRDIWPLAHPAFAAQYGDGFYRSSDVVFTVGQEIALSGMRAEVTGVSPDGRPLEARLRFDVPLEDTTLRWLQWDWKSRRYQPFTPPAIGETVQTPGPF